MVDSRSNAAVCDQVFYTHAKKRLIFHSDRGAQYARKKFNNVIDSYKMITRSRSRKGNCCDNEAAQ
jgi:transposase InsO family protein